jgi:predicted nucleic acid-binding protein
LDKIFLDANVLFSAAYRPNAGLARLWELRGVELLTSDYAAQEAATNLPEDDQRARLSKLLKKVRIVTALAPLPPEVALPEKDQPILQAALHAQATHLLTGDKEHFGRYFGLRLTGVLVLPPAEYFERRRKGKTR